MVETITAVGMVISATPISEYDKRLVILTKEFGKITALQEVQESLQAHFLVAVSQWLLESLHCIEGEMHIQLRQ